MKKYSNAHRADMWKKREYVSNKEKYLNKQAIFNALHQCLMDFHRIVRILLINTESMDSKH
jgi:hypothetical protein